MAWMKADKIMLTSSFTVFFLWRVGSWKKALVAAFLCLVKSSTMPQVSSLWMSYRWNIGLSFNHQDQKLQYALKIWPIHHKCDNVVCWGWVKSMISSSLCCWMILMMDLDCCSLNCWWSVFAAEVSLLSSGTWEVFAIFLFHLAPLLVCLIGIMLIFYLQVVGRYWVVHHHSTSLLQYHACWLAEQAHEQCWWMCWWHISTFQDPSTLDLILIEIVTFLITCTIGRLQSLPNLVDIDDTSHKCWC